MRQRHQAHLLTLNVGSSSIKAALYVVHDAAQPDTVARFERIDLSADLPGGQPGLDALFGSLKTQNSSLLAHKLKTQNSLDAIGHRVVHGGSRYTEPQLVTPDVIATIEELAQIDPEHAPLALAGIRAAAAAFPGVPQVACFDTAFHRQMPRVAQLYALPQHLRDKGIARYGFHGLSYEYIMRELSREYSNKVPARIIIAHLGSGASMAAVRDGVGIDTTMGFTPTGGLVMSTRTGDLDPGVLLYLLDSEGMSVEAISKLVNKQSGLLGVSGTTGDMRELLALEEAEVQSSKFKVQSGTSTLNLEPGTLNSSLNRAAEAVELFCYHAKKHIGALAAALDGLDLLVFTAGIGEHSAPIRDRICAGLGFLGIRLDPARNGIHAPVISAEESQVTVRVIKTDENMMIAEHVNQLRITNYEFEPVIRNS